MKRIKVECWDQGQCWLTGEVIEFVPVGMSASAIIKTDEGWLHLVELTGIKVIEDK